MLFIIIPYAHLSSPTLKLEGPAPDGRLLPKLLVSPVLPAGASLQNL